MKKEKSETSTRDMRGNISLIFNILIVAFTITGTVIMMGKAANGTGLTSSGLENLKYYTVLSNEFCGLVALLWIVCRLLKIKFPAVLKLIAVTGVALTFFMVACFLAPMYPDMNMYAGGNFWFHLVVPVTAMAEFLLLKTDTKIPFKATFIAASSSFVYGICYVINILINGIGKWPDTNDWYGFLNWGYFIGFVIFVCTLLLTWAVACFLRFLNLLIATFLGSRPKSAGGKDK